MTKLSTLLVCGCQQTTRTLRRWQKPGEPKCIAGVQKSPRTPPHLWKPSRSLSSSGQVGRWLPWNVLYMCNLCTWSQLAIHYANNRRLMKQHRSIALVSEEYCSWSISIVLFTWVKQCCPRSHYHVWELWLFISVFRLAWQLTGQLTRPFVMCFCRGHHRL